MYKQVIEQQAAAAVGAAEAPPLPQTQQRRMLRVLKELDPHALEKLAYWENYYKEMESGDPERAKRLRANIQKVLKHLDEEVGGVCRVYMGVWGWCLSAPERGGGGNSGPGCVWSWADCILHCLELC